MPGVISDRFETLAQSLRVFAERQLGFQHLFLVDAPEAVGNLDHALDAILNAFHGLYDAVKGEAPEAFNFYDDAICALVLRLRNARHHNQANGLRSIYRYARREDAPKDYLLIDFAAGETEEGGSFTEHYVSWADVEAINACQPARYADQIEAGNAAIRADIFKEWCQQHGYGTNRMFVNIIPIICAACHACTGSLAPHIQAESVEGEAFLNIFQTVEPARFAEQDCVELTSAVFWPR